MGAKAGKRAVHRTPAGTRALAWTGCPMSAQRHIARRLMDEWRAGQGKRASKGVPELMRALEFIAQQVADGESWKANPSPISLTRKQVRTAWHRAVSQRRRAEHGPPGGNADAWWEQIDAIAKRWGLEMTRDEWETATKTAASSPAPQVAA